jgi:hypothetical protein
VSDRKVAYAAVVVAEKGCAVAIVEQDVAGYALDPTEPAFDTWEQARERATRKNEGINVSPRDAWDIVASSMRKSAETGVRWSPRGS